MASSVVNYLRGSLLGGGRATKSRDDDADAEASLECIARDALSKFPDSDYELAMYFFQNAGLPEFVGASGNNGGGSDRLVKCARNIKSTIDLADDPDNNGGGGGDGNQQHREFQIEESLELLLEECELIVVSSEQGVRGGGDVGDANADPDDAAQLQQPIRVPTVRFGKTELQMPIATLGCMRFQQEWGPRVTKMNQVDADCQDNLLAILKQAVRYGMVHIETARGYGCSELQIGVALMQMFLTGLVRREDLIIQTKIAPNQDPKAFRKDLETSFANLQVEYLDLFAFHGLHTNDQLKWIFGDAYTDVNDDDGEEDEGDDDDDDDNGADTTKETCMSIIQEYVQAGKIRHVGFSSHASTEFILKCIDTDEFEYVNLHYHGYFGSYTASGRGHDGNGNLDCVKRLAEKDMGIFIISPFDKGGRLYDPSRKLRKLTLPEFEPMQFQCNFIWNLHRLQDNEALPQLHTFVSRSD